MEFKKIVCPLCTDENYSIIRKSAEMDDKEISLIYSSSSDNKLFEQVVKCKKCSLVYLNPILENSVIVESYKNAIDDKFITQNKLRIETFKDSLSELLSYVRKNQNIQLDKINALDIGCAGGAYLKAAKDLGLNVVGVEPSSYLSKFAREEYGVKVYSGTLEEQSFEAHQFGLISMWDVIEHLTNPNHVLKLIKTLIQPNGILVINYPDYSTIIARILGKKWPFWLSVHLTYFNKQTIKLLLENNGFEVKRYRRHWQKLELGYVFSRAASYFYFFKYIEKLLIFLKLDKIPFYYYLGQIQVVAYNKK